MIRVERGIARHEVEPHVYTAANQRAVRSYGGNVDRDGRRSWPREFMVRQNHTSVLVDNWINAHQVLGTVGFPYGENGVCLKHAIHERTDLVGFHHAKDS